MSKATPAPKLTQERLKELLNYEPGTGIFRWRVSRASAKPGSIAGGFSDDGYLKIGIDGKRYFAHRLAWLYTDGYFPENEVDHINRDKADNRLCNLREVSKSCNMHNAGVPKNNKSGVKGVLWEPIAGKWKSQIKVGGKVFNLGTYKEFIKAVNARWDAEIKYGFTTCDTESSAKKYLVEHGIDVDNINQD